ncbi:hypothetical protein B0T22DRAFT_463654 [Podospora appendiculata]|uniref:Uncharacterized protein n=1 Tax=Podospora appendiculata TaxID=314037 RepID=A0AAE0XDI9_9PEZI|nr:hypothetical protein B0T22DRAFT_463654 [Podospora appendiculata]
MADGNADNITSLADLTFPYLSTLVVNHGDRLVRNSTGCEAASNLLPLSNLGILGLQPHGANSEHINLTVTVDPATLDVGLQHLQHFANELFPYPLNASNIGDVATWWMNATTQDTQDTKDFLSAVINSCPSTFCQSSAITIGNPDIVGIGMLIAVGMLLLLAFAFTITSFGPMINIVSRAVDKAHKERDHFCFRQALIGTVDELFSAVFVFGLAVIVSTFVYRYNTEARFDVLMADALSMFCSTSVIMLAAPYWSHNEFRTHSTASFIVIAILTIALFATHFHVVNIHASPVELACGTGKGSVNFRDGDPFDMRLFRFIPIGFACWCLALIGATFHHPYINKYQPYDPYGRRARGQPRRTPTAAERVKLALWKIVESFPTVFGLIGLVIYAVYFFNTYKMMKDTYGEAFTKAEKTWGFGQYLAVFTWLPPILTFLHMYFAGMKKMLQARLPKGMKVSHRVEKSLDPGVEWGNMPSSESHSFLKNPTHTMSYAMDPTRRSREE